MNIIIIGKLTDIFPAEIFGNFEKRVVWVLETDVQYPNHYAVEFHQGDGHQLDAYKVGEMVKMKVDVKGKKWQKNEKQGVINTLKCWSIERAGAAKAVPSERQQTGGIAHQSDQGYKPVGDGVDDLPF